MNEEVNFEGKILKRRWQILKKLGGGSQGNVFMTFDKKLNLIVAIKIEENDDINKLNHEGKIIKSLNQEENKQLGVPFLHWIGSDPSLP